jgi:hypothetical protein
MLRNADRNRYIMRVDSNICISTRNSSSAMSASSLPRVKSPNSIPSLTRTWRKDTYTAINPLERPELALKGKTVMITGGGSGIGRGMTKAFADAGASKIAILGRREASLHAIARDIHAGYPTVELSTHAADLVDLDGVRNVANQIGPWDVLIANAGYLPNVKLLVDSDPDDWWRAFEVSQSARTSIILIG